MGYGTICNIIEGRFRKLPDPIRVDISKFGEFLFVFRNITHCVYGGFEFCLCMCVYLSRPRPAKESRDLFLYIRLGVCGRRVSLRL